MRKAFGTHPDKKQKLAEYSESSVVAFVTLLRPIVGELGMTQGRHFAHNDTRRHDEMDNDVEVLNAKGFSATLPAGEDFEATYKQALARIWPEWCSNQDHWDEIPDCDGVYTWGNMDSNQFRMDSGVSITMGNSILNCVIKKVDGDCDGVVKKVDGDCDGVVNFKACFVFEALPDSEDG
jgi:hypothetical protein